jgi:hypothetical protein
VSDGGVATVSENLRLQQVYATLADRIGYRRDTALDLAGAAADLGAVAGRQDPDRAGKRRARPTSSWADRLQPGQRPSGEWRVQLDRLQNEVPPVSYEAARQVTGELGAPPEELYASFSPRPRPSRCITPSWPTVPRWPSRCSGPAWTGRCTPTWGGPADGALRRVPRRDCQKARHPAGLAGHLGGAGLPQRTAVLARPG